MKYLLTCLLFMSACSAVAKTEPISGPITKTVVASGDCWAQTHYLDAGKAERQAAFDKCACEAGHCE